jgi:hypothetical protein
LAQYAGNNCTGKAPALEHTFQAAVDHLWLQTPVAPHAALRYS